MLEDIDDWSDTIKVEVPLLAEAELRCPVIKSLHVAVSRHVVRVKVFAIELTVFPQLVGELVEVFACRLDDVVAGVCRSQHGEGQVLHASLRHANVVG